MMQREDTQSASDDQTARDAVNVPFEDAPIDASTDADLRMLVRVLARQAAREVFKLELTRCVSLN
jgi:hypothetical protein